MCCFSKGWFCRKGSKWPSLWRRISIAGKQGAIWMWRELRKFLLFKGRSNFPVIWYIPFVRLHLVSLYLLNDAIILYESQWGYCGFDAEHCDCPECVNYKLKEVSAEFSIPTVPSVPSRKQPSPTFPTLESNRRPVAQTSSSFRTRGSSNIETPSLQSSGRPVAQSSSSFRTRGSSSIDTPTLESSRRPKPQSSSSFRTRGSSSAETTSKERENGRGSSRFRNTPSRFRDSSSFRRRATTTTTERPKSFNEYEEYVYYDYW